MKKTGTKATACRYAKRYRVIRAPRCGCATCEKKWADKKKDRI